MKKLVVVFLTGTAILAGAAISAEDPISARKAVMQNVGDAAKMGGAMLKGEMEYNPAAAQLALRVMNSAALAVGELYPKGSETGMETTASPKIWSDMGGFKAALVKFQTDTAAGMMKPEEIEFFDKESFGEAFGRATANCKSCHENFRVQKN